MGCLDKKMDEVIALKTLKDRSGELFAMKYFLGIDEISPTLEQSLKMQLKLSMNYQQSHRCNCTTYGTFNFS